jgi:hypothetical protein
MSNEVVQLFMNGTAFGRSFGWGLFRIVKNMDVFAKPPWMGSRRS